MTVRVLGFLLLFSCLVVVVQSIGIYRSLPLTDEQFVVRGIDDRKLGGQTNVSVTKVDQGWLVDCEIIKDAYAWPYCELRFEVKGEDGKAIPLKLTDDGQPLGLDLTPYSEVVIDANYVASSNNTLPNFRFQIRNFNPAYSDGRREDTLKYNGVEFTPQARPLTLPFSQLQVYSWWIAENAVPLKHQEVEMTDVHTIQLATGNLIEPGRYQIAVKSIVLRGKLVADELVYFYLVFLWVALAVLWVLASLFSLRTRTYKAHEKHSELSLLNQLLDSETKQLQLKANQDPLTGALNRAGLDHYLTSQQNKDTKSAMSVLYLDLDHFKRINDTYGHATGDEILEQFAARIMQMTRDGDVLVRWGGEEFLLLLPNSRLAQATALANKLLVAVETAIWPQNIALTMSVGVAEHVDETLTKTLDRADVALYRAKANGRNRIEVADDD